jgi:hypothetical protein
MRKSIASWVIRAVRAALLAEDRQVRSYQLPLESLEKRMMLSAAPMDVAVATPVSVASITNATITGSFNDPAPSLMAAEAEIDISGGPTPQDISSSGAGITNFTYAIPFLSVGDHTVAVYSIGSGSSKVLVDSKTITVQNSLFNEEYYLSQNPDVAAAVASGQFASGYDHYIEYGQFEGRSPSPFWNEADYLAANPDVAAAVQAGTISSGFMHFYLYGQYENRQGLLYFNTQYYLQNNPDVAAAVANHTITSAYEHYVLFGEYEGRSPTPLFIPSIYDQDNQDILPFVNGQPFTSDFEQFVMYGQNEGRVTTNQSAGQIGIEYSLLGDADLDGVVNQVDFGILQTIITSSPGWDQGSFNY